MEIVCNYACQIYRPILAPSVTMDFHWKPLYRYLLKYNNRTFIGFWDIFFFLRHTEMFSRYTTQSRVIPSKSRYTRICLKIYEELVWRNERLFSQGEVKKEVFEMKLSFLFPFIFHLTPFQKKKRKKCNSIICKGKGKVYEWPQLSKPAPSNSLEGKKKYWRPIWANLLSLYW